MQNLKKICNTRYYSFNSQMYLERAVLEEFLLLLKESLWFRNLVLKSGSRQP